MAHAHGDRGHSTVRVADTARGLILLFGLQLAAPCTHTFPGDRPPPPWLALLAMQYGSTCRQHLQL